MNYDLFDSHFAKFQDDLDILVENAKIKKEEYDNIPILAKWKHLSSDYKKKQIIEDEDFNTGDNTWSSILENNDINISGDRVMKRLQFALSNIPGIERHEYQIQFHQEILMALLPKIYQSEWGAYSSVILEKYGVKKYRPERFFITPRRFGKTTAAVSFAIGAAYSIPNITIGIFSTGKRTAGKFKNQILKYLRQMPNFDNLVIKNNSEEIELQFGPNDIRVINCYPGTVDVCIFLFPFFFFCAHQF